MMTAGAWQVRVAVAGDRGEGTLSVPVPTLPQATLGMTLALRASALRADAAALRRLHRDRLGDGARSAARRRRDARRRRAPPRPHRGGHRRVPSSPPPCSSATGGGRPKRRATRDTSTNRCRRTPTVTPDGRLQARAARSRLDCDPPPRRFRHRSRSPDAPVRGVARARSPVASASATRSRPARSNTGCRRCRPASTSCSPISCTRPASRRRSPAARHAGDSRRAADRRRQRVGANRSPPDGGRIVWVRDATPLVPKRLTMFTFRVEDANGQPATRSRAVHGDAGPRRLRAARSPRVRARAPVGIGADGGDGDRDAGGRVSRPARAARRGGCRRRCRFRTGFRSRATIGSSCR